MMNEVNEVGICKLFQGQGAMSCGFTGLVTLQGFLRSSSWSGEVLANAHPTYYGMRLGWRAAF